MSFCPNCGVENQEQAKFCKSCGTEIPVIVEEEISVSTESGVVLKKGNKRIKWMISLVAIIIILAGGFAFGKELIINRDPFTKTAYGFKKISDAKTISATSITKVDFSSIIDDEDFKMAMQVMKDFSLKTNIKMNKKEDQIFIHEELLYKDDGIIDANIYMDKEVVSIEVPKLYKDPLYLKWEEMDDLMKELDGPELHYKDYLKLLNIEKSKDGKQISKDYFTFFKESLSEYIEKGEKVEVTIQDGEKEKTIKCSEVIVTLDEKDSMDLLEDLLDKVKDDERIVTLIHEKMDEFVTIAKENGDIKELDIDEDELEDQLDDAKDNVEDHYEDAIEEMINGLENGSEDVDYQYEQETKYRFDSKNDIRNILTTNTIKLEDPYSDQEIEIEVVNETTLDTINGKVDIEKPKDEDGVNIADTSDSEWSQIAEEISFNMYAEIMKKIPMFEEVLSDMGIYL